MDLTSHEVGELDKGLGQFPFSFETGSWKIGDEDVGLPTACVIVPTVKHNITWMAKYMYDREMELCPHVKTTMCPKLIGMQVAGGLWGVTTATVQQVVVMHHFGLKRVLMANQLVGKRNMELISAILTQDPTFEFFCLVDSVENVEALTEFFEAKKLKLNVLVEIGMKGGRTGIRGGTTLAKVFQALKTASGTLVTRGIEFYEGVFHTVEEVREICSKAFEALMFLALAFPGVESLPEIIISAAGSEWFDIVAQEISNFRSANFGKTPFDSRKLIPVLRPGCYVVHDVGMYKVTEDRIRSHSKGKTLQPALKVVAYVQSRPEPDLVILGLGKRDVAIDCGFPKPCSFVTRNSAPLLKEASARAQLKRNARSQAEFNRRLDRLDSPLFRMSSQIEGEGVQKTSFSEDVLSELPQHGQWKKCPVNWEVTKVMDQHAFLRVAPGDPLTQGDIVSLDISHPCNTFSLWRQILLVDESYTVLDIAPTYF